MFVRIVVLLAVLGVTACAPTVKETAAVANYSNLLNSSNYLRVLHTMPTPTVEPTPVVIPVKVTFYSASWQEGTADGITASGQPVTEETAASRDLPFGTVIDLHGIGRRVITDRGGLGRNHIDAYVPTREEAFQRGVVYTTMTIVQDK